MLIRRPSAEFGRPVNLLFCSPPWQRLSGAACLCCSSVTARREHRLLIGAPLRPDGSATMFLATLLILRARRAVVFRAGLLNIGAEGQLYVAAFATAWADRLRESSRRCSCPGFAQPRRSNRGHESRRRVRVSRGHGVMMNFVALPVSSSPHHYRIPGDQFCRAFDFCQHSASGRFPASRSVSLNLAFVLALSRAPWSTCFWRTKWIRAACDWQLRQPPIRRYFGATAHWRDGHLGRSRHGRYQ